MINVLLINFFLSRSRTNLLNTLLDFFVQMRTQKKRWIIITNEHDKPPLFNGISEEGYTSKLHFGYQEYNSPFSSSVPCTEHPMSNDHNKDEQHSINLDFHSLFFEDVENVKIEIQMTEVNVQWHRSGVSGELRESI